MYMPTCSYSSLAYITCAAADRRSIHGGVYRLQNSAVGG